MKITKLSLYIAIIMFLCSCRTQHKLNYSSEFIVPDQKFNENEVASELDYTNDNNWAFRSDLHDYRKILPNNYKLKIIPESIIYHHEGVSWKNKSKFIEGTISPFTHYLNIRNHILILKKHIKLFNPIGVIIYQFIKILSYLIYFIIRLRFNKFKMVLKGLVDAIKFKK